MQAAPLAAATGDWSDKLVGPFGALVLAIAVGIFLGRYFMARLEKNDAERKDREDKANAERTAREQQDREDRKDREKEDRDERKVLLTSMIGAINTMNATLLAVRDDLLGGAACRAPTGELEASGARRLRKVTDPRGDGSV